jgi:acyl homoserine lactone synthase
LFTGMIEFGLTRQLTDIVTVTDARMERILCRAQWPLRRLGSPRPIGKTSKCLASGFSASGKPGVSTAP